jgi:RNA polymerase sigma-70 factor (ECF subfamily)
MPDELRSSALVTHHDRLCGAARRLCGSPEDADDLVQDTYVRVLDKRRALDSGAAASAYLLRALHNTHVSGLRRDHRRPQTVPLAHEQPTVMAPASASPATTLFVRELLRAVAALPVQQRRALTAIDVLGLSYAEAASALDTPIGTVMSRLHRARHRVVAAMAA